MNVKYYTVKAVISTDGTETRDMRGFDTIDEALVRYHSDLTSNINATNCESILEVIFNSLGVVIRNETWVKPEEEEEETE